jgi:hypothetical protein
MRRPAALLIPFMAATLLAIGAGPAQAAGVHSCKSIANPYAGTRYEGVDLSGIRARGVSCTTARKVVRGAHHKALGLTPPPSGIRTFTWHGWKVTGNLRGDSDSYLATKSGHRVRWRF